MPEMAQESLEDLFRSCTVQIMKGGKESGSGFFVAPGLVVTCVHVVGGTEPVSTYQGDKAELTIRWKKIISAPVRMVRRLCDQDKLMPDLDVGYPDVALLTVKLAKHPCVGIDEDLPDIREDPNFQIYGYPYEGGSGDCLTPGRLIYRGKKEYRDKKGEEQVLIDLASDTIKPGMSGSALLNLRSGNVCGIVVATRSETYPDGGFAVPWKALGKHLKGVINANREFHREDKRWASAARITEQPKSNPLEEAYIATRPPPPRGLVGREELISRAEKALHSGKSVSLYGLGGVGKTAVAAWLADHLGSKFEQVQWFKLGKGLTLGTREIMQLCANSLRYVNGSLPQLPTDLSKTDLSREELDEWRRFMRAAAGERGLLIVLDDLWSGEAAKRTAAALRLGAPSVMVVTGRDVELVAANVPGGSVEKVSSLGEEEALLLLLKEIGEPAVPDKFHPDLRALVRWIGGLPVAVVILAGVLRSKWWDRSESGLQDVLATLNDRRTRLQQDDPTDYFDLSLRVVLETSFDILSPDARLVLAGLSVLRPEPASFTESVMVDLAITLALAQPQGQKHLAAREERAKAALKQLHGASLLSSRTPIVVGDRENALSLHPVVADYAREYLLPEVSQYQLFHRKAARYFKEIVEEPIGNSYSAQFRYERPAWQDAAVNWVYHLGHEPAVAARRALATLYLDAFWWWGCFIPYPFCDDLLGWWERMEVSPRSRKAHDEAGRLLRQFQDTYPTGLEKTGKGDWKTVRTALVRLRKLLGVAEDDEHAAWRHDAERRHLRAITNIFLAHADHYVAGESAESRAEALKAADAYYREAWELIDQDDDSWNRPWVLFEWAETKHEQGLDGIEEMCDRAEHLAVQEGDNEILARLAYLRGQLAWSREELNKTFRTLGLAVVYAYAFHISGESQAPDAYTQAFYDQLTSWILDRVEELPEHTRQTACEALLTVWGDSWRPPRPLDATTLATPGGRAELAATLWPPGPTNDELESSRHRYVGQVRANIERIYANPPDGLLPVPLDLPGHG